MATIVAPTLAEIQNSGQHGNQSVSHCKYTFNANPAGDKLQAIKLYAGSKITDVRVINAALGAGTTVSVGYETLDGLTSAPTAFINAQSTVAAGRILTAAAPLTLTKDSIINLTIGGGAATGQVDLVVEYDYRGT